MPPKTSDSYILPTLRGQHCFVLESNVGLWRSLFEVVKEFIDEIVLEATPRGIQLESFDKMSVALLNLHLKPNMFKHYEVSNSESPMVPLEIKLNVVELLRVIKCGSDMDLIRFSIKENDKDTLIINIAGATKSRFALACLDYVDVNRVEAMDLDIYDHHERMSVSEFTHVVKNLRGFGDAVSIDLCQDKSGTASLCVLSTTGEGIRKAEFSIELENAKDQDCKACLSNEYLAKVAKMLSLSKDTFMLHLDSEGRPCVFQVEIGGGLGEMTVYVCQRELH